MPNPTARDTTTHDAHYQLYRPRRQCRLCEAHPLAAEDAVARNNLQHEVEAV